MSVVVDEDVEVDDVEVVAGGAELVVAAPVVVVTAWLHTDTSSLHAACTALTQAFLQRARALPESPLQSDSWQARISSRHAFRPHGGGAAIAGKASSSAASTAPTINRPNPTILM